MLRPLLKKGDVLHITLYFSITYKPEATVPHTNRNPHPNKDMHIKSPKRL